MGVITRIGRAPGVRRLVRRADPPGETRENADPDDEEPTWCAACGRELLFGVTRCPDCGGEGVSAEERARRAGGLPAAGGGATGWTLPDLPGAV